MRKSKKCGSCTKKVLKAVKLLKGAIDNGLPFEDAALYAGFDENNLTKAYRTLLTDLPLREKANIVSKINWDN